MTGYKRTVVYIYIKMVACKYHYKYHVIVTHPEYSLNKKYNSQRDILNELRTCPLKIASRPTLYNILHCVGKRSKYINYITITKIHEMI
jgi:hypothetical protein